MSSTKEFHCSISICLCNCSFWNLIFNCISQSVVSIISPNSLEMCFVWNWFSDFMWISDLIFLDNLRGQFCYRIIFFFELCSSLFGSSIKTKNESCLLICMSEWVKSVVLSIFMKISTISPPHWLRNFIKEQSWRSSFTKLFSSQPFERIWLTSLFTPILHWCCFRHEISMCLIPS